MMANFFQISKVLPEMLPMITAVVLVAVCGGGCQFVVPTLSGV